MIEAIHLEKSYDRRVIRDLNFRLEDGECLLVTGESGAGKTTLMRLLLGLEKPDAGRVNCTEKSVSVVFQEDRLLEDFDILDNIRLVSDLNREQIFREYVRVLPEDAFDKKLREYSGGMKRRAAILRAVLSESAAIFMDEPFKGLDEENKNRVIDYFIKNRRGRTLFLITHDKDEAELFHPEKRIHLKY